MLIDKVAPTRGVMKITTSLGLALLPTPRESSNEVFPLYDIKGLLNAKCGRTGDNKPYSPVGYHVLKAWANKVILGDEAVTLNDASAQFQTLGTRGPAESRKKPTCQGG